MRDLPGATSDESGARATEWRLQSIVSRSVRVPVWAMVVASVLMLAVPSAVVVTQIDPFGASVRDEAPIGNPEADVEEENSRDISALAREFEPILQGEIVNENEPEHRNEALPRSPRQEFLTEQGVSPDEYGVDYGADEIQRLQRELEAIQRNSAMLRSLAREQAGDLSSVYSSLEVTQGDKNQELEDLRERVEDLDTRVETVDEIARELREMLDLPELESGVGGPSALQSDESDPWLAVRSEIVSIEHRAGALVVNLDEVNSEIETRIAEIEAAEAEAEAEAAAAAEAERASNQSNAPEAANNQSDEPEVEYYSSMPSGWPIDGPITSRFGLRDNPFGAGSNMHTGIDISAPMGTPVRATGGGTVRTASQQGGYGLLVIIDHGGGVSTWYGHNSRMLVSPGQSVNSGDVIAEVGSTGMSTGPHVHYEIRINNQAQDPLPYMQGQR